MIRINLKPGSKRARAGKSLAGGLSAIKSIPGRIKDPWPMAAVVVSGLIVAFLGWVWISSVSRLHSLESEMQTARSENHRYRVFLSEKRRAEAARDSVVTQIATIRAVDGDRYVWPHILDEVTRALPNYTWLTEIVGVAGPPQADSTVIAPPAVGVQITGRTMDIQGFTRYMRQMEESPWLTDVTVISTQTVVDRGRAVTMFIVKASYVRAGPARAEAGAASGPGEN